MSPSLPAQLLLIFLCSTATLHAQTPSPSPSPSQRQTQDQPGHDHHSHDQHNMQLSAAGMVMNHNTTQLPRDCTELNGEHTFTVYGGVEFAAEHPGLIYGLSQYEYLVEPCSLVTVTFVNNDRVRHQWMLHGLPKYLYPQGMFTLEAAAGQRQTGSFIVPSDRKTYLVHCDVAQHMEKGMKAQLKVAGGDGDLFAIPTISSGFKLDGYLPDYSGALVVAAALLGVLVTVAMVARGTTQR